MNASAVDLTAGALLELLGVFLRETQTPGRNPPTATLDSRLERDLGLDSLARAELLLRLEQTFNVRLPEQALATDTPRELLRLLLAARHGEQAALAVTARYQPPAPAAVAPLQAATLLDVLNGQAQANPDRTYLYLYGGEDQLEAELTFAALQQGARAVAGGLLALGLQPRETVALMLPTSAAYIHAFFGVLLAGGVPTPIYPPARPSQLEEHLRRHVKILTNAQTVMLVTIPEAAAVGRLLQAQAPAIRRVVTPEALLQADAGWSPPTVRPQDIAFLQYTSGSTGDPKGVMLTHANLLANIRAMVERVQAGPRDVFVSWLPLYHDMGLIGAFLATLYCTASLVLLSPLSFLARPSRWLWAIHRHRGTLSAAPNFAYELCLRSVSAANLQGLDLSSWRMALNGAEPINIATLERFIRRYAPYGFRAGAMAPVYGLAECSVGLALQPPDRGVVVDRIQRDPFMRDGKAAPAAADDPEPLSFVSCGRVLTGHRIRIVDEQGRELPERREGRLEFQGPSAAAGYYRNPEATRRLLHDGWLDSGDRAYLADGDVYITGRVKDMIIRGGRNFYPYELEDTVGRLPGIRQGGVAVFASTDKAVGGERLVVVAETRHKTPAEREALRQRIQTAAVELLGTPADDVALVPPHAVLKTSSGKIRRNAIRERYERDDLAKPVPAPWLQLVRLGLNSGRARLGRWARAGLARLYAGYAWSVFLLLAPLVWLALLILPRPGWRWTAARWGGRSTAALLGVRLRVTGLENLPRDRPCILVANHASYVDSLILVTALPYPFSYVAKRELRDWLPLRLPLQRLDTLFVERFDPRRSAAEADQLVASVQSGRSLALFPEGTFDRLPGLLPFRMGAFVAAAKAAAPIAPVTLRGARVVLPPGSWSPHWGTVHIEVGSLLYPEGNDWRTAVKLRDAARAAMLRASGEPDRSG